MIFTWTLLGNVRYFYHIGAGFYYDVSTIPFDNFELITFCDANIIKQLELNTSIPWQKYPINELYEKLIKSKKIFLPIEHVCTFYAKYQDVTMYSNRHAKFYVMNKI